MTRYLNRSGDSGVVEYEIASDSSIVAFSKRSGGTSGYLYNYDKPGRQNVEKMKRLAEAGKGLSSFVGKTIKKNYAEKLW